MSMQGQGAIAPAGDLGLRVIRGGSDPEPVGIGLGKELSLAEIIQYGYPQRGLPDEVNDWRSDNRKFTLAKSLRKFIPARFAARKLGLPYMWSQLWLAKIEAGTGRRIEFGLAGVRVVTDNGVAFIVDAFQNTVEMENMKYHGIGETNTAENQTDSALAAEITTEYNPDNTRATGTTTEGASANIYRTVGTNTVDAAVGAVEHGIFDNATSGSGVLLDRTVFTIVNLASGDGLESTYELTLTAGS